MEKPSIPEHIRALAGISSCTKQADFADLAWCEEISAENFGGALEKIDNMLLEQPDAVSTRLWWLRCQLELERVPSTALLAPIDEILAMEQECLEHTKLASSTVLAAALRLYEREQTRLALSLLERSITLPAALEALSDSEMLRLKTFYKSCLDYEIATAPLRREGRSYIASLEKKREALKKDLDSPSASEKKDSVHEELETTVIRQSPQHAEKRSPATRLLFAFLLLSIICIAAASFVYSFSPTRIFGTDSKQLLAMNLMPVEKPTAPLPGPFTRQTIEALESAEEQSLDLVGQRLEKLAVAGSSSDSSAKDAKTPQAASQNGVAAYASGEGAEDLVPISSLPDARNDIPGKTLPKADPSVLPKTKKVKIVGTSPRKSSTGQSVLPGTEGAVDVPPIVRKEKNSSSSSKDLYGNPLKAHQVQRFDPPLVYRTITQTEVLSAPSLLSKSVARLARDTPVHVTRQVGHWLELRSTEGSIGYIYAQDAVTADKR